MKTVNIKISGEGSFYTFSKFADTPQANEFVTGKRDWNELTGEGYVYLEFEDILDGDIYDFPYLTRITEITADGEDIQKKKGKYINTPTFFKDEWGITAPCYVQSSCRTTLFEVTYEIELEDDEEFDPKKLQLIKSNYEFEFLPYAIVLPFIMYDGKKIYTNDDLTCDCRTSCAYTKDYRDDWYKILC